MLTQGPMEGTMRFLGDVVERVDDAADMPSADAVELALVVPDLTLGRVAPDPNIFGPNRTQIGLTSNPRTKKKRRPVRVAAKLVRVQVTIIDRRQSNDSALICLLQWPLAEFWKNVTRVCETAPKATPALAERTC